jgi:hypothetical protein
LKEDTWITCKIELPPDGEAVMTKIDDSKGIRNVQALKRRGRLWFFPNRSMYVYYVPTHWQRIRTKSAQGENASDGLTV